MTAARRLEVPELHANRAGETPQREPNPCLAPGVEDGATSRLLAELCRVASRLHGLAAQASDGDDDGVRAVAEEVSRLLRHSVEQLDGLEQRHGSDGADAFAELDGRAGSFSGAPIAVTTAPQLADVCFAGRLELKQAVQELIRAQSSEDLQVAIETSLRKLRRAIRAAVEAAQLGGFGEPPGGEQLREHAGFDLDASLAVRRLYAQFRRSLRRAESESQVSVLTALRYAAGALATLMSSANYERARISDRCLLRRLQQRLLLWGHGEKAVDRGLELLHDVWTSADLLRGINRRQELRVHDAALIAELGRRAEAATATAEWLGLLAPLAGLDDELDALVEAAGHGVDAKAVDAILARLAQLS